MFWKVIKSDSNDNDNNDDNNDSSSYNDVVRLVLIVIFVKYTTIFVYLKEWKMNLKIVKWKVWKF